MLAAGTVRFAPGETSKNITIPVVDDAYFEGDEKIYVTLSNPTGGLTLISPSTAELTIVDNDTSPGTVNPLDTPQFFVRQHYLDFLGREPEQGGFDYWTAQLNQCGSDQACRNARRVGVSDAFFYEQEFQETATYVYRVYKASFGTLPGAPNRGNLTYAQFMPDRAGVTGGPQLDQSKTNFANAFVQRPSFIAVYPTSMTAAEYVEALNTNTGNSLTPAQRDTLVAGLSAPSPTETRGSVLRKIADNLVFIDREYNASFVLMEYFGYLRRDPDQGGYDFWLGQVNRFPIRDIAVQHAMVCSFITSAEYQQRFSALVPHTNAECGQ
jgi:hypothetical protein